MRRKKTGRIIAGLLAVCMTMGSLAGCSGKTGQPAANQNGSQGSLANGAEGGDGQVGNGQVGNGQGGSGQTGEGEAPNAQSSDAQSGEGNQGDPVTLKVFLTNKNIVDGSYAKTEIEKATNTKLDIIQVPTKDLDNKLNILLASGERPDVIQCETETMEGQLLASGILLPLNEYWDGYPNLKNARDPATWDLMRYDDGNIYSIGIKNPNPLCIIAYRKDWLDKLGLKVPTTLDEYYQVATAVAKEDPDGDGKDDTYAFGGYQNVDTGWFDHIFGAFGALPNYWMVKAGHIVNGSVQPEIQSALAYLNKMYKAGLIDPEFVTDDPKRWQQKVKSGVFGAGTTKIHIFDHNNWSNYYAPFKKNNPKGEMVYGPILKGGSDSPVGVRMASNRGWLRTFVSKDSKHPEAALRLLDYLTSKEGNRFAQYGKEGEHYKWDGDRLVKLIDTETADKLDLNKFFIGNTVLFDDASPELFDAFDFSHTIALAQPTDGIFIDELADYYPKLRELTNTQFIQMIVGEIPVDQGFASFVKEWNQRGGEKLVKAMDDAYQKRLLLK